MALFFQRVQKLRGPVTTVSPDGQSGMLDSDSSSPVDASRSDDDDDELLRVKRKNVTLETALGEFLEDSTGEEEAAVKKKLTTRTQQVKKLQRKKIKLNTKIVFDEDGEVDQNIKILFFYWTTFVCWQPIDRDQPHGKDVKMTRKTKDFHSKDNTGDSVGILPVPLEEADGVETGGIDLHRVERTMRRRDVKDKDDYSKRVKAKHKVNVDLCWRCMCVLWESTPAWVCPWYLYDCVALILKCMGVLMGWDLCNYSNCRMGYFVSSCMVIFPRWRGCLVARGTHNSNYTLLDISDTVVCLACEAMCGCGDVKLSLNFKCATQIHCDVNAGYNSVVQMFWSVVHLFPCCEMCMAATFLSQKNCRTRLILNMKKYMDEAFLGHCLYVAVV